MQWFAQNGIGGEAIIWLIIAFFWVVAQLASRAKEKAARRRLEEGPSETSQQQPQEPANERGFENEMRRFFESIGAEVEEEEEDAPAPPPPPRRRRAARAEPKSAPIHLVERRPAPEPAIADTNLGDIDSSIDDSALDTDRAYALTEHRTESMNAFVDPRTLLVNLNYLRMNMPMIPVAGLDTTHEARPRPVIHGRHALRDALTTQIILSNPLAMGEDKASYTKRVV